MNAGETIGAGVPVTDARIVTEDLGGSALSGAARAGLLPEWYRPRPASRAEWLKYLEEVARSAPSVGWLDALTPALAASGRAARRLERVARAGGVVISTGQQAGLFGGPLMTFLKALSALTLADRLEQELSVPAAPVFWAATDDADFDEAGKVQIAVPGGVRTLRLHERPPAGMPMSAAPLGDMASLIEQLSDACGSIVDPAPLTAVRAAYRSGTTVGSAYVMLLRSLLEPLGIAVLDASHGAVRRAAAPVLVRALELGEEIERALRARSAAMRKSGFTPQVEEIAGLSLVFVSEDGIKRRVPVRESEGARQTVPELLSPNVLLRPLVERSILPSAAYLGGPGEIAYFAQVSAVAQVLGAPVPLVLPRWSVTIIEPHVDRLLDRLGLTVAELSAVHAAEGRLARAALPAEVARVLEAMRRTVAEAFAKLRAADGESLVPPTSVEGTHRAVAHRIARLERRYVAAVKRRESDLMADVATVRGALYPDGVRQERRLSFIPLLTRGARPLVNQLLARAQVHAASLLEPRVFAATSDAEAASPG